MNSLPHPPHSCACGKPVTALARRPFDPVYCAPSSRGCESFRAGHLRPQEPSETLATTPASSRKVSRFIPCPFRIVSSSNSTPVAHRSLRAMFEACHIVEQTVGAERAETPATMSALLSHVSSIVRCTFCMSPSCIHGVQSRWSIRVLQREIIILSCTVLVK